MADHEELLHAFVLSGDLLFCAACRETKDKSEFYNSKSSKTGKQSRCIQCQAKSSEILSKDGQVAYKSSMSKLRSENPAEYTRRVRGYNLKASHGIKQDDYEAMASKQGHACAICRSKEPGGPGDRFHVDHNHATGKIRGLLCAKCNTAIGLLKEDAIVIQRALNYLKKYSKDS
mgnify:CR=1 FL=1